MKTGIVRTGGVCELFSFVICIGALLFSPFAFGQTNSWTNSVSGNWQDAYWSLGLPAANQDVSLTNDGLKTLAIGSETSESFPQTLALNSLTISSPANSSNTLLMNFAGTNTPLTVSSVTVADNSAMKMFSSALLLDGPNGVGMQLGGEFDQNDSVVSGRQVNVGYIGPGVYNFNSGFFAVSNLWVGSAYGGIFNQNGGTNLTLITDVEGGEYIQNDGYFNGNIYFNGGTFRQRGGILQYPLTIFSGGYVLENGTHYGSIKVPSPNGSYDPGYGNVLQTGGANFGDVNIGSDGGRGNYTLSNGVCSGGLFVGEQGSYTQWNGTLITGDATIDGGPVYEKGGGGEVELGSFDLNGGTVSCSSMLVSGNYDQHNATNYVAGTLSIFGEFGHFFSDGTLCVSNLTMETFGETVAKAVSFEGTIVVSNELLVAPGPPGFLGSGTLIVSNINVPSGATFDFYGEINQSGIFSGDATVSLNGAGPHHLGRLQPGTNFVIWLPASECIVDIADNSRISWGGILTVKQWSGSLYGGGAQRILFGTNNSALTPQQLSQIQFQDPAGLAPGNYPARILATGEIVPDSGAFLPMKMGMAADTNGAWKLMVGGSIGDSYAIEASTDLVHWVPWSTQSNENGTVTVGDCDVTNFPGRFYRARLIP